MRVFLIIIGLLLAINLAKAQEYKLYPPVLKGKLSFEEVLAKRRSVREFKDSPLTLEEVSQLLWAAQGITDPKRNLRTAPSAGALYPLEVYVVIGKVKDVPQGVYRYIPKEHKIQLVKSGDVREKLAQAALGQVWVKEAPVVICISAEFERTKRKYGQRAWRYVYMEAGHAAQNVLLQAVALGLEVVPVGAFYDGEVQHTLGLAEKQLPIYLIPVGRR